MVPIKYEAAVAMYPEESLLRARCVVWTTSNLKISVIICHDNRSFLSPQLGADVNVQSDLCPEMVSRYHDVRLPGPSVACEVIRYARGIVLY
jgi:hypothetical protein